MVADSRGTYNALKSATTDKVETATVYGELGACTGVLGFLFLSRFKAGCKGALGCLLKRILLKISIIRIFTKPTYVSQCNSYDTKTFKTTVRMKYEKVLCGL